MTDADRTAFEEIYRLWLVGTGKRERKTRRICEAMLGERVCANIRADYEAAKQRETIT